MARTTSATGLEPGDLEVAAAACAAALRPYADADWSVLAGSLQWDISRTVSHMIGACAKYTMYLATAGQSYIGLTCSRFDGATQIEMVDSIMPVAQGLANLARWAPAGTTGFHAVGQRSPAQYIAMAGEELLLHTYDALLGLGGAFQPPNEIARKALSSAYPGADPNPDAWTALIRSSGRAVPVHPDQ